MLTFYMLTFYMLTFYVNVLYANILFRKECYGLFGWEETVSKKVVNQKYKRLALRFHPGNFHYIIFIILFIY